jgi:hypothetical protein
MKNLMNETKDYSWIKDELNNIPQELSIDLTEFEPGDDESEDDEEFIIDDDGADADYDIEFDQ